jgi:putative FmdB family regulatory protein
MPTYDYECLSCGHRFERFHSMTAEPESQCPECGGPVKKLIGTGAGILFRGSGFYITDYRSSDYKKKAKEDGGGPSSTSGKEAAGGGTGPVPAKPSAGSGGTSSSSET